MNPATFSGQGLACERGGKPLFAGVNFALAAGQSLHVQGANGSGKTTLLRLMCGLIPASAGQLFWQGQPCDQVRTALTSQLQYLGHHLALKEELSALENLRFEARLAQRKSSDADIAKALCSMGLSGREHLPLQIFSQGQKRRVALARLLLGGALLWVLDEPFVALDAAACDVLSGLMEDHLERGGMVVFTSHQNVTLRRGESRVLTLGAP